MQFKPVFHALHQFQNRLYLRPGGGIDCDAVVPISVIRLGHPFSLGIIFASGFLGVGIRLLHGGFHHLIEALLHHGESLPVISLQQVKLHEFPGPFLIPAPSVDSHRTVPEIHGRAAAPCSGIAQKTKIPAIYDLFQLIIRHTGNHACGKHLLPVPDSLQIAPVSACGMIVFGKGKHFLKIRPVKFTGSRLPVHKFIHGCAAEPGQHRFVCGKTAYGIEILSVVFQYPQQLRKSDAALSPGHICVSPYGMDLERRRNAV